MHGRVDVDELDPPFGDLYPSRDGSRGMVCAIPWIRRRGIPHTADRLPMLQLNVAAPSRRRNDERLKLFLNRSKLYRPPVGTAGPAVRTLFHRWAAGPYLGSTIADVHKMPDEVTRDARDVGLARGSFGQRKTAPDFSGAVGESVQTFN